MTAAFSWLYDCLIAPLAIAYGAAYRGCAEALGYGYGLLALSALTTLLLMPLRAKVAATQEDERRLRRVIEPQLARIRAESTGEARHERVRRLYRRYAYHPIMSIRAMWGLLLQVPFIFAAYQMLSELSALRLVSFWGIDSLAAPDGLLPGGVNLLPILMTVLNLAAAFLAPHATRRETGQAVVIAALFLACLYGAPSALLVYWTANNFLSLVEVLVARARPAAGERDAGRDAVDDMIAAAKTPAPDAGHPVPNSALVAYGFAWAVAPWTLAFLLGERNDAMRAGGKPFYFTFTGLDLALGALLLAAAGGEAFRWRARRNAGVPTGPTRIAGLAICAAGGLFMFAGWAGSWRLKTMSGRLFDQLAWAYAALALTACGLACGRLNRALWTAFTRAADRWGGMLYGPAVVAGAALVVLFVPMASFQSAPEVFDISAVAALRTMLPYFLCACYGGVYLRVVLPRAALARTGLAAAYGVTVACVMALAFPPSGVVDGHAFLPDVPDGDGARWGALARDLAALTGSLALLWALARNNALRFAGRGLWMCAFGFAGFAVYAAAVSPGGGTGGPSAAPPGDAADARNADWPAFHRSLFAFSPDRPNVLVVMLDMFHGGHVRRMLDEDPAFAESFPGFVWYPDTVSDGANTRLSFPAMLGGPAYTPAAIQARGGNERLVDVWLRATTELPDRFLRAGYAVGQFGVRRALGIPDDRTLADLLGDPPGELIDAEMPSAYVRRARSLAAPDRGVPAATGPAEFLLSVGVFRAAPNAMRGALLARGWFERGSETDALFEGLAIPLLMPAFATADATRPTFKVFVSNLTHSPYVLGPDSLVPLPRDERLAVNETGDAHYFTDRHAMRMMAALAARLRDLGVYANTRILFVSDHDNKDDPHPYLASLGRIAADDVRPHALLMVKDFDAAGPLRVSDRLMQGHDMPALAVAGLDGPRDPFPPPPDDRARVRHHGAGRIHLTPNTRDPLTRIRVYTVRGPMSAPANWTSPE